jgi:hypothetical protein
MANATVAVDRLKALQVALDVTTEITFNQQTARGDGLDDLIEMFRAEVLGEHIWGDVRVFEDLFGGTWADPVDVRKGGLNAFVAGDVYAEKSGHGWLRSTELSLPLLVARILANHTHDILALHDAARFAKALHGCSYFHKIVEKSFTDLEDKKTALGNRYSQCDQAYPRYFWREHSALSSRRRGEQLAELLRVAMLKIAPYADFP